MESTYYRPIFKSNKLKLSNFLEQNTYLSQAVLNSDIPAEYTNVYFYFANEEKNRINFFLILKSEDDKLFFCLNGHIGINENKNIFCSTGTYSSFESILNHKEKLHDFLQKAIELNKIYLFQEKLQIKLVEKNSPLKIKI